MAFYSHRISQQCRELQNQLELTKQSQGEHTQFIEQKMIEIQVRIQHGPTCFNPFRSPWQASKLRQDQCCGLASFWFDVDPGPDQDPTHKIYTVHVQKPEIFVTLFTAFLGYIVLSFSSGFRTFDVLDSIRNFSRKMCYRYYLYMWLKWIRIRICRSWMPILIGSAKWYLSDRIRIQSTASDAKVIIATWSHVLHFDFPLLFLCWSW